MQNMEPLGDRVIVKVFDMEKTTEGGLIIPDMYQNAPAEGIVVACGPGKKNDDGTRVLVDVEIGNHVLFAKYAGSEVEMNGKKHLILVENDIISIIRKTH